MIISKEAEKSFNKIFNSNFDQNKHSKMDIRWLLPSYDIPVSCGEPRGILMKLGIFYLKHHDKKT